MAKKALFKLYIKYVPLSVLHAHQLFQKVVLR